MVPGIGPEYQANQLEDFGICNSPLQNAHEDFMIDTGEEADNVRLHDPCESFLKLLCAKDGRMGSTPSATGVRVADKGSLKQWLKHLHEGVMYDSIAKRGGTDFSRFRVGNVEMMIEAWQISLLNQFTLQRQEFFFPCKVELCRRLTITLAAATTLVRSQQILPTHELGP